MDLELVAHSTCTSTQPAHVQVEFAAKSKTVHEFAITLYIIAVQFSGDAKPMSRNMRSQCQWKQQKRDSMLKTNAIACTVLDFAVNSTCT